MKSVRRGSEILIPIDKERSRKGRVPSRETKKAGSKPAEICWNAPNVPNVTQVVSACVRELTGKWSDWKTRRKINKTCRQQLIFTKERQLKKFNKIYIKIIIKIQFVLLKRSVERHPIEIRFMESAGIC